MAALRLILLLTGLVFLIALAAWELRRPRQGRRDAIGRPEHGERELGQLPEESLAKPASTAPPGARLQRIAPSLVPPMNGPVGVSGAEGMDTPEGMSPEGTEAHPSIHPPPAPEAMLTDCPRPSEPTASSAPVMVSHEPMPPEQMPPDQQPSAVGSALAPDTVLSPALADATAPPRVDWPPEAERHIIALRVVAASEERLSGRAARQALAACGFVHGRYGIFHQPSEDGRALLSCASLSKPGIFDPGAMDFQRFVGLSLFTILPGPLPPMAALERLLETARDLTQRLHARLQDEVGGPLDAARIAALRDAVQELPTDLLGAEPSA